MAGKLERAGHSVWWDRHIEGGSEYSDEIETALKESDVVLVAWSESAIHSTWVRDEAAEGRDRGKLVPLLLDSAMPPMGFRQLQTISLAGWSGRGSPPDFQAILKAIDARLNPGRAPNAAPAVEPRRSARLPALGLATLAALVLMVAIWWGLGKSRSADAVPVLAVIPFSDLSPEADKAYLGEGMAEAILTALAKEQNIRVIGQNSAMQLRDAGDRATEMRRAMGITHLLEGSARSFGGQLRMNVRLVDAADGRQLWTEEYRRPLDNIFAVQDEIGRAVADRLRGSLGDGPAATPITEADNYALYLAARSKMRDRRQSSLTSALSLARRVVENDPNYAPGHALYAELVWHLGVDNYGTLPTDRVTSVAQRHARRAIQLDPEAPDGYAALGLTLAEEAAIEPLKKAIALDPARAELRQWLGHSYADLGRHVEALQQFRSATEMDPLWPPGAMLLAYTLGASGRHDEAEASLQKFEQRGGSRAVATKVRGDLAQYRGDLSEAVRLSFAAMALDPETPQADLSASWYSYLLGLHDRAASASRRLPLYSRLQMTGQQDRLLREIRNDGSRVWQHPDYFAAIEALAFARDWQTISDLVMAKPEISAEVCRDTERIQLTINMAAGLKATGRHAEANRLIACAQKVLEQQSRGPIRASFLATGWLLGTRAQVHALQGRRDNAFADLNRAVANGALTPYGRGLSDLPVFDRYRSDPEYRKIDAQLKKLAAKERSEAIRALAPV